MRTLLNIIWLVLSGFWLAVTYFAVGLVLLIPIVTIPFSIACFRLAGYVFWPFGREVVAKPTAGVGSAIGNVIWFIIAGIPLAVMHLASALALAVTIIGIPMAWADIKMIPLAMFPLGKQVVPSRQAFGSW
ncbi:MAG: YccF domain-containing protein [Cellulomonadaceae bacterium]|nr:YccF domain-containing protein [Cellulomonadaceae bacterium]